LVGYSQEPVPQVGTAFRIRLVDVAVPLRAHPISGTAQVRWKMVDAAGYEFFPDRYRYDILLTIVVREGVTPPAVPSLPDNGTMDSGLDQN